MPSILMDAHVLGRVELRSEMSVYIDECTYIILYTV